MPYLGPALLITVGCIDPGNWATNYAAGQESGYGLLWVIVLSTGLLLFVQQLAARLGVLSGRSLAELVRERCPRPVGAALGGSIVVASTATAVAEYLGAALGLNILFGVPLLAGTVLTGAVVAVLLVTQAYRRIEAIIVALLALIVIGYGAQLWYVPANGGDILAGLRPQMHSNQLFLVLGILGATVMPHNVYLHSAVVRSRDWAHAPRPGLAQFADTTLGMLLGGALNAVMMIVAAAAFSGTGISGGNLGIAHASLQESRPAVAFLFGAGLLATGVTSALTSSLSEATTAAGLFGPRPGFRFGLLLAIVPTLALIAWLGDPVKLLVWSQVILALQLPFTLLPLTWFNRDQALLGKQRLGLMPFGVALAITLGLIAVNVVFLLRQFG